jgi:pimeloyl-ACP methyl ester carboxylesterase
MYPLDLLADIRTVYALDLPGYGDSPPIPEAATGERLATAVMEFADALGLEQFDLNGHSFSAGVCAYVAARHPHRVRRLVLTSTSTYRNGIERRMMGPMHSVLTLWTALRRPWMGRTPLVYRNVSRRFFHRLPSDDGLLGEIFADFLRMDRRTASESANSAADPNFHMVLQSINTPTLVVSGSNDTIMPTVGTPLIADLVPNAELVWIEQCGHLPMIEQPHQYHQVVRHFLNGCEG